MADIKQSLTWGMVNRMGLEPAEAIKKVAEIEAPLGVLVEHQYLRRRALSEEEKKRPGRKSEVYEVNPEVLKR